MFSCIKILIKCIVFVCLSLCKKYWVSIIVNYRYWNIRMAISGYSDEGVRKIIDHYFKLVLVSGSASQRSIRFLVFLNKKPMNCSGFICFVIIIRWLVLLFQKPNRTGFCPFYWFCSGFAHQPCSKQSALLLGPIQPCSQNTVCVHIRNHKIQKTWYWKIETKDSSIMIGFPICKINVNTFIKWYLIDIVTPDSIIMCKYRQR